jgi:putative addiction module component (TIGR02574 family)
VATVEAMKFEDIQRQALGLSAQERARLAQELLDSIDRLPGSELEALWLDEAARRASEIDSGAAVLVSGTEVARKARALAR